MDSHSIATSIEALPPQDSPVADEKLSVFPPEISPTSANYALALTKSLGPEAFEISEPPVDKKPKKSLPKPESPETKTGWKKVTKKHSPANTKNVRSSKKIIYPQNLIKYLLNELDLSKQFIENEIIQTRYIMVNGRAKDFWQVSINEIRRFVDSERKTRHPKGFSYYNDGILFEEQIYSRKEIYASPFFQGRLYKLFKAKFPKNYVTVFNHRFKKTTFVKFSI
jgi:hypothetical protein